MQPEIPNMPVGSEATPTGPAPNLERMPSLPTPEAGLDTGGERVGQTAELSAAAASATTASTTVVPQQPVVAQDDTSLSSNPLTAGHDDVIEKEWVDKAKKIISDTKDDPFKREEQVSQLQKDYLQKRYGKELGASL